MPHNLSRNPITGQMSLMFYGETPWHGLGIQLDHPATSAEAINAAGLDWEVTKHPLYVRDGQGYHRVDDKFLMMRGDQLEWGHGFGIVSSGYTPLQNREAFSFFDDIVGQGAAVYHTAGALGQGERVWILAKLPDNIRVVGNDICDKYLLLSNSHDGQSSVQMKFTPIRVVCQNTLTMALSHGSAVRISHTRNIQDRMRRARELLGIISERYDEIAQEFTLMAKVKMDTEKLGQYYRLVFPDPRNSADENALEHVIYNRAAAESLFINGSGNQEKGVENTLWAAYNGVTEMVDYRKSFKNQEMRLNNIWFGEGYLLKARAYAVAVEMLKTWAG